MERGACNVCLVLEMRVYPYPTLSMVIFQEYWQRYLVLVL